MDIQQQIRLTAQAIQERKAEDLVILDLGEVSSSLDYFVICTASAGLQINAVAERVRELLKEHGVMPQSIEGPSLRWILMNYGTIVVHIMTKEARDYYDLEGLWSDAKAVTL